MCGDSRTVLQHIPTESVQLIVTSPPYWNLVDYGYKNQIGTSKYEEYLASLLQVWKECERILASNGKLCINTPIIPINKLINNSQHTRVIKNINNDIETSILSKTHLVRFSLYIWQKQTAGQLMFGSYPFPPNIYENNYVEFINIFVKLGVPRVIPTIVKEKNRLTKEEWLDLTNQIWRITPVTNKKVRDIHPAPFPILLPLRFIKMYTFGGTLDIGFDGDIVVDPFGGIGTTAMAAKILGRRYITVDGSREYSKEAFKRIKDTLENTAVDIVLKKPKEGGELNVF